MVATPAASSGRAAHRPRSLGPRKAVLLLAAAWLCASPAAAGCRIAVVDMFFDPGRDTGDQGDLIAADAADIDGDGVRDPVFHGDLVSLFVAGEGVETVPFRVDPRRGSKLQLLMRLREIGDRVRGGEALDAVLLCWESSTPISAVTDTLRPQDRARYREVVRGWGESDEGWRLTYGIIRELERLADAGLLVVTIAGNAGPAWVNTYTFADGVVVVGAVEADPDREWATSNALIDVQAQSSYTIRLVGERERPAWGYDVNEDGVADIGLRRGSSWLRMHGGLRSTPRILQGTSFAAPTALKRMIVSRLDAGG